MGGQAVNGLHVGVVSQPQSSGLRPADAGMAGEIGHQVAGGTQFHCLAALPVGGAEQRGRVAAQGVAGQFPGPGIHGHHHQGRGFHLLVRVLVEGAVADAEIAVLFLASQYPFGGVETGVGEGGPEVHAVAGHGVVEAAVARRPAVGHPGVPGSCVFTGGQADSVVAEQVRGQAVDRLQCGQAASARHAPGGCTTLYLI